MSKAVLVINGKSKQFDSIELAQAYMRENSLTNVEIVNIDNSPLFKEIPDECVHQFEMLVPRVPMLAPMSMSGQERRRERRAKERANRK